MIESLSVTDVAVVGVCGNESSDGRGDIGDRSDSVLEHVGAFRRVDSSATGDAAHVGAVCDRLIGCGW